MERIRYDYDTFLKDLRTLADSIDERFDAIVAVARGGMTMAHMLGEFWNIRNVFVVNAVGYEDTRKLGESKIFNIPDLAGCQRVLVVDDIADSGETLACVMGKLKERYPEKRFKTATLFYKPDALFQPDYRVKEAKGWIDFFWNEDMRRYNGSRIA
ncbi:phosphoribosyltransferase [Hydrogenimonas sp.]